MVCILDKVICMNRKLVWFSIFSIFFLVWGMSSSGALPKETLAKSALPAMESTPDNSELTEPVTIPVTGKSELGWGILIFYGLIGLAALILILALLDSANHSTTFYAKRKTSREVAQNK
jgi:hypothetical protein